MTIVSTVGIDVEVRFAETDMMQVVHHAAYLPWLEMGRIAFMKARGAPYTEISRTHNFSVTDLSLQIRRPLAFGDTVHLLTALDSLSSRKLCFSYELRAGQKDLLVATGRTEHVCVDLQGRATRIPLDLASRLQAT